jgi:hypothetical protein
MSRADIDIQISGGEHSFAHPLFRPGELVKGTASIYPNRDINCRSLTIQLKWHTEGRGTRHEQMIEELNVFNGQLQSGMPQAYDFSFQLPSNPWSHEGHYISVVWGVFVKIDVPMAKDIHHVANFILAPQREPTNEW